MRTLSERSEVRSGWFGTECGRKLRRSLLERRSEAWSLTRWAGVCLALMAGTACGSKVSAPSPSVVPELPPAAARVVVSDPQRDLLARKPTGFLRQQLMLSLRDVASGRGFEGRGAAVVAVGKALRLVVLGPGGTTALDVWIARSRYRVQIPALGKVSRGDVSTPRAQMRGLPIGLLRRLLVDPFGGRLLHVQTKARAGDGGLELLTFAQREDVLEVRSRTLVDGRSQLRVWWLEDGRLVEYATGQEAEVTAPSAPSPGQYMPLFPSSLVYVSLEPALEARVRAEPAAVVDPGELPADVFDDPDGSSVSRQDVASQVTAGLAAAGVH